MPGDFDFDDFNIDDLGENTVSDQDIDDESSLIDDDGLDELDNSQSDIKKTAIVAIICGIVLIIAVFMIVNIINHVGNKDQKVEDARQSEVQVDTNKNSNDAKKNNTQQGQDQGQQSQSQQGQNQQVVINKTSDGWVEFSTGDDLTFKDDYITSTYTVTSVKHYVKVVDSKSNLMIKTVLSGALAGYIGTYDLEVPYSLGSKVEPGLSFDVTVQIGETTDGKSVVGEIRY